VPEHDAERRLGHEGQLADQELVEDDANRVKVRATVDLFAARLLGRHVVGRADHEPFGREVTRERLVLLVHRPHELGDPEVANLDEIGRLPLVIGAVQKQDVLRLQVAVHDADVVRGREGGEGLRDDVDDAPVTDGPVARHHREQVLPLREFHDQVEEPVGLAEIEHAQRVRMIELRGGKGLALEPLDESGLVGELTVQDFDGNGLVKRILVRAVHRPHRSEADQCFDRVLAPQCGADKRVCRDVRHARAF
jgi:hypothetical protein